MNIFDSINITDQALISIFLKSFAILGAVGFLLYGIVLIRQTNLMIRTFETTKKSLFNTIAWIHVLVGILLLAFVLLFL